jgi:hypothetical protein
MATASSLYCRTQLLLAAEAVHAKAASRWAARAATLSR